MSEATPASGTAPPSGRTPWGLIAPALALFVVVVVIPLAMTVLLSFHDWGQYKGIEPVLILKNWREIWADPYFHEMFLRTLRIAGFATLITVLLGAPEAYILNRMRGTWKIYRGSIPVMPTFHPAYLLRDPTKKGDVWSDLQQVMKQLGKQLPKRS